MIKLTLKEKIDQYYEDITLFEKYILNTVPFSEYTVKQYLNSHPYLALRLGIYYCNHHYLSNEEIYKQLLKLPFMDDHLFQFVYNCQLDDKEYNLILKLLPYYEKWPCIQKKSKEFSWILFYIQKYTGNVDAVLTGIKIFYRIKAINDPLIAMDIFKIVEWLLSQDLTDQQKKKLDKYILRIYKEAPNQNLRESIINVFPQYEDNLGVIDLLKMLGENKNELD